MSVKSNQDHTTLSSKGGGTSSVAATRHDAGYEAPEGANPSSFMVFVVATALDSLNRCLQLLRELPQDQPALLVLIRAQKVAGLSEELQRLLGLWRLLHPVLTGTTYRASNRRLKFLLALLSSAGPALWLERLAGHVRPATAKHRRAIEALTLLATTPTRQLRFESPAVEDDLGARQDLASIAGFGELDGRFSVAELTVMLEQESRAWRGVPTNQLAQELVVDKGFVRSYLRGRRGLQHAMRSAPSFDRPDRRAIRDMAGWQLWVVSFAAQLKLFGRNRDDARQRDAWYAHHLAECLDEAVTLLRMLDDESFLKRARKHLPQKTMKRANRVIATRLERLLERHQLLGAKVYARNPAELSYDLARDVEALGSQSGLNMLVLAGL